MLLDKETSTKFILLVAWPGPVYWTDKYKTFIQNILENDCLCVKSKTCHYSDVIMTTMAYQPTNLMVVYSIVYSDADQWKHQNSASLAFFRGIHRWPVNLLHNGPVTRKTFPFDDVIHSADSSIKLSGRHTTQTQTSEVRWAARFIGHWVVPSMFA